MLCIHPAGQSERRAGARMSAPRSQSSLCHLRRWSTAKAHRLPSSTALTHCKSMSWVESSGSESYAHYEMRQGRQP